MTQIITEDYVNRLIYLHVDTVTLGFDPRVMQQEHRLRRRLDSNGERSFDPMVSFSGNESIGGGKFTSTLVKLRTGVRVVPYDTPHSLDILNQIVNISDGLSDRGVFDRSGVLSNVDIDATYSPVEIREIGGSSSSVDIPKIKQAWNRSLSPSSLIGLILLQVDGVFLQSPIGSVLDISILNASGSLVLSQLGIPVNNEGYFEFSQAYTPSPGVNMVSFATIILPGQNPIKSATPISFPEFE